MRHARPSFRYAGAGLCYASLTFRYASPPFRYAKTHFRYARTEFRYACASFRYAGVGFRYATRENRYAKTWFRYAKTCYSVVFDQLPGVFIESSGDAAVFRLCGLSGWGGGSMFKNVMVRPSPPKSNTQRQREFRERNPGYYGRLHHKRKAECEALRLKLEAEAAEKAPVETFAIEIIKLPLMLPAPVITFDIFSMNLPMKTSKQEEASPVAVVNGR